MEIKCCRVFMKSLTSFMLVSMMVVLVASCGTSKKAKKQPQIVNADDEKDKDVPAKTDTVGVVTPDKKDDGNKKDPDQTRPTNSDRTYHVALLLPLDAESGRIDNNSNLRFIQYYGGIKLAGKDLNTDGAVINVSVYDSKDLLKTDMFPAHLDLIIGPYASASSESSKAELQKIIEFGKKNKIMVVSPWYSNSKATENNEYYIQIKPNIREHFNKIVQNIYDEGNQSKVVLVGRNNNNDYKYLEYFQTVAKAYSKGKDKDRPLDQMLINEKSLFTEDTIFNSKIQQGKSIFVFPNYSYNDEEYLRSVLTKLVGEKGNKNVTAVGLPIILESEKIGYNLYQGLNMELVVPDFVEKDDYRVRQFTKSYYELYKTIPASDAFEAYDLFSFIGEALAKYGRDFIKKIHYMGDYYLQTSFDIKPVYEEGDDSFSKVQFYENKHLDIIKFRNGAFERI